MDTAPAASQARWCFFSASPVPAALRPWVALHRPMAVIADDPKLRGWLNQDLTGQCWIIDGTDPTWPGCVARLDELGGLRRCPWVLWLPEAAGTGGADPIADQAYEQGAVDVWVGADLIDIRRRASGLLRRLCSPQGLPAQLRRLHATHHALRASLDNIPAPIFVKDAQGLYTDCNQAFLDYIGLPREGVVGKSVYDVAPPELAQVYEAADRRLLEAGGRQIYDAQVRWADGSLRDVTFHKSVFLDAQGRAAGQAGAIFDITERRLLETGLRTLAETDALTGLANRRNFIDTASQQLREACAARQPLALLLFDLDHFKQTNDQFGHAAGDAVLRRVALVVGQDLRAGDLLARIGGDEFAVLLHGADEVHAVAQRLPGLVEQMSLRWSDDPLPATISVGAAVVIPANHTVDSALQQADMALYEAKRQGRNRAVVRDERLPG